MKKHHRKPFSEDWFRSILVTRGWMTPLQTHKKYSARFLVSFILYNPKICTGGQLHSMVNSSSCSFVRITNPIRKVLFGLKDRLKGNPQTELQLRSQLNCDCSLSILYQTLVSAWQFVKVQISKNVLIV